MGNFDPIVAEHIKDNYGPFVGYVVKGDLEDNLCCDFCGEPLATRIILKCEKVSNDFIVCLGECLKYLVDETSYSRLTINASSLDVGMSLPSSENTMIEGLIKLSESYVAKGLGKSWNAPKSIIRQYRSGRSITKKQCKCLAMFCDSCKKESLNG